jgi:hypothetical protein
MMNPKFFIILALNSLPLISIAATPDACALLTAKDASGLAGQSVTAVPSSDPTMCRYHGAGGLGVEIHVEVVSDAAAAHAQFPKKSG